MEIAVKLPPPVDQRAHSLRTADGLSLQAQLHLPKAPRGWAVVCHPHPQFGGNMNNKVVTMLCRAFAARDLATLRFNFRGVSASEGEHSRGEQESNDVLAALHDAERIVPVEGARVIAGYSFGAAMAMAALESEPIAHDHLLLVAPPLAWRDIARPILAAPRGPQVVVGDADSFCSIDQARGLVEHYAESGASLRVINENDHFFHGKLAELSEAVYEMIDGC